MRYSRHLQESEEASINITPLIDVVFVVLIMFIIIAPMLELDHVNLATAETRDERFIKDVHQASPISLYVRSDNTIWLSNQKLDNHNLIPIFKEYKRRYPTATPQLFHDRKAYFETYQSVKSALEASGFEEMDVILQPG